MQQSRGPQPPYLRIAADLIRQIDNGELLPGEQLPTVANLAKLHGVGLSTAKRAHAELKRLGYTESVAGWGVFVAARPGQEHPTS